MRRFPVAALLLLAAACGRDLPGPGEARAVRLLIVEPGEIAAYVGLDVAFDVKVQKEDGTITSVLGSPNLTLESSNPAVFTINRMGAGRAIAVGKSTIDARFEELAATVAVDVVPGAPVSLRLQPMTVEIPKGLSEPLQAILTLSGGAELNVTDSAFGTTYFGFATRIISVDADGVVTGLEVGETAVTAEHKGLRATAEVEVTAEANPFVSIELAPEMMSMAIGQVSRFTLTGVKSDGTREMIGLPNPSVVFTIDNRAIAMINADGSCLALRRGTAVVTAKLDTLTDTARVEVRPADDRVVSLSVVPNPISLDIGDSTQLTVTAFFLSGAMADVTRASEGTTYMPPRGRIIDVTPDGFVRALSEGSGNLTVSNGGVDVRVRVQVGRNLIGIRAAPESFTLPVNAAGFFDVFAQYSDGSEDVITFEGDLSVISTVPMVADVFAPGQVFALAPGFADLQMTYRGFFAFVRIEVLSGRLISISISAQSPLMVGDTRQYFVTGIYDDGSMADLTFDPSISVFADNPGILFVQLGFITGQNTGTTNLNAQHIDGLFATVVVRVIDMGTTLSSIELVAPSQIEVNGIDFFQVLAHWSDGSTTDITFDPSLILQTSNSMVLDIDAGLLFGISVGFSQLSATYQSQFDSQRIDVVETNDTIVAIVWAPLQLNVEIGVTSIAQLFAFTASGNQIDITHDPQASYSWTGPIDVVIGALGVEVNGLMQGNGEVVGTYLGFQATLPVNVGSAPEIIGIRVDPSSVIVLVGNTVTLSVFAQFSDGSEALVTGAQVFSLDPSIATATGQTIEGISAGSTDVVVSYGFFTAFIQVQVVTQRPPEIFTVAPDAIPVGSPDTVINLIGLRFNPGDTVLISGVPVATQVISSSTIIATVPDFLLIFVGTLTVEITGINGTSNTVTITVGEAPIIESWSPTGLLAGSTVVVTVIGSGLTALSASAVDLSASIVETSFDGSWVRISVSADASLSSGARTVTITNPFGSAMFTMDVIATTGLMDLVVAANQTILLTGTNAYNNVTVQTGGLIVGTGGTVPLTILAAGDIIIRGSISVGGVSGALGFTNPADGGNGGPGGGGGGGGGDGDAMSGANGGGGAPPGFDGLGGQGSGTPAGGGGGDGAGGGAMFQCGAGGGGGALGGDGGSGGGDFGPESGGFGGLAGGDGSDFGAGTGGGGGTTCGNNSGGGGGGGGGFLVLQTAPGRSITIDGMIRAHGGNGGTGFNGTGGGGGGSGGRVEIHAEAGTILVNDTISVRGGDGGGSDFGDTGGGGGGGMIILDATPGGSVTAALGFLDVTAGNAGASLGGGELGAAGSDGTFSISP